MMQTISSTLASLNMSDSPPILQTESLGIHRAYAVLPPGHGKSYLHLKFPWLVEADSLVNCKATKELAEARTLAKETGKWGSYDKMWTDEILKLELGNPLVIMVPDESVGKYLAPVCIFKGVLALDQWAKNLKDRKGTVEKYMYSRDSALRAGAPIYETNDDLASALYLGSMMWMAWTISRPDGLD